MAIVSRLIKTIDTVTEWIGRTTAWLLLVAVLVSATNAIVRKAFGISSNAWLELQWYLYGAVFMLGAAWALKHNAHVRIDVISSRLTRRAHGARQDRLLQVPSLADHVSHRVTMAHPHHVLLDDRAFIQFLGDVVKAGPISSRARSRPSSSNSTRWTKTRASRSVC